MLFAGPFHPEAWTVLAPFLSPGSRRDPHPNPPPQSRARLSEFAFTVGRAVPAARSSDSAFAISPFRIEAGGPCLPPLHRSRSQATRTARTPLLLLLLFAFTFPLLKLTFHALFGLFRYVVDDR